MIRPACFLLASLTLAACASPDAPPAEAPAAAAADMGAMTPSTYTDLRFVDGMIAHHEMAINMARVIQQRGLRPDVKGLAEDIIGAQSAEIDTMRAWRARWLVGAPAAPPSADDMAAMGMAMPLDSLTSAAAPDLPFLDMMLPHHAGAIVMAGEAAVYTERPEVRALAREIVRAQAREIGQMQAWLDAGGG